MRKKLDWIDELNKGAAKHLVRLGVEKDWKKAFDGMTKRRKKRERKTKTTRTMTRAKKRRLIPRIGPI